MILPVYNVISASIFSNQANNDSVSRHRVIG